jgi:hypothetical protein
MPMLCQLIQLLTTGSYRRPIMEVAVKVEEDQVATVEVAQEAVEDPEVMEKTHPSTNSSLLCPKMIKNQKYINMKIIKISTKQWTNIGTWVTTIITVSSTSIPSLLESGFYATDCHSKPNSVTCLRTRKDHLV